MVMAEELNVAWYRERNVYIPLSKSFRSANISAISIIVLVLRKISVAKRTV